MNDGHEDISCESKIKWIQLAVVTVNGNPPPTESHVSTHTAHQHKQFCGRVNGVKEQFLTSHVDD